MASCCRRPLGSNIRVQIPCVINSCGVQSLCCSHLAIQSTRMPSMRWFARTFPLVCRSPLRSRSLAIFTSLATARTLYPALAFDSDCCLRHASSESTWHRPAIWSKRLKSRELRVRVFRPYCALEQQDDRRNWENRPGSYAQGDPSVQNLMWTPSL